jgi:predicted DNA-binding antitoxin AbrB/MazE fold protein
MVRRIDAIFTQGTFRPIEPLTLPEGTRVHLSVEEDAPAAQPTRIAKIHSPKLANQKRSADFVLLCTELQ